MIPNMKRENLRFTSKRTINTYHPNLYWGISHNRRTGVVFLFCLFCCCRNETILPFAPEVFILPLHNTAGGRRFVRFECLNEPWRREDIVQSQEPQHGGEDIGLGQLCGALCPFDLFYRLVSFYCFTAVSNS